MTKTKHTINGKTIGHFYDLDSGEKLYLSQCTGRDKFDSCWWFANYTVFKCRDGGYAIGVVTKSEGVWLMRIEDFEASPHLRTRYVNGGRLWGLPVTQFPVNPYVNAERIKKRVGIRQGHSKDRKVQSGTLVTHGVPTE